MNIKKFIAGSVASVMAVTSLAAFASADASFPYTAQLGFADGSWAAQDWASTVEITGDGTYTLKANCLWTDEDTGDEVPAEINGIMVFVVDILGLGADLGLSSEAEDKWGMDQVSFSDVKVTVDGKDIALDASKLVWGDLEGKGNLRLEIYNAYGNTTVSEAYDASVSPVNPADISAATELSVTFTLDTGSASAAAPAEPAATEAATTEAAASVGNANTAATADKNNADTGVEGVAAIAGIAIVAAGAVIVSKKRK